MISAISSVRRYLTLLLTLLLLGAAAASYAVTLQEEIDLGRKIDVEILKQMPLSSDDEAQKQINEYGQKLVKNVQRPDIKYHFKVLKDDDLNAFSIPGGYIYFSQRLWDVLNKDEQIGVLGHEIVHVDRRHALDAISKQQRRQIWLAVLLGAVGANQNIGQIAGLAESLYTLKYSRGDERQADEFGVDLVAKAGYNPAGLLLAMRKIKRFEDERGGAPPKIFSSHPPTKERLNYLAELLRKRGIAVPGEQVKDVANPYKIGTVTDIKGDTAFFTSSKPLQVGDVVWLMGNGWDYNYENKTSVPIARAIIKSAGATYSAGVRQMPTAKKGEIAKGIGVYDPPKPQLPAGIGRLEPVGGKAGLLGKLAVDKQLSKFDRLLAVQTVWDKKLANLAAGNVGYLVIREPASPTGYVAAGRKEHSYSPMSDGAVLVELTDPHQARWIGPIISLGRSGETIEVMPIRPVANDKVYEVAAPAWGEDGYEKRVVGKARLSSTSGKIVLRMSGYLNGWSMDDIQNGFDVYEEAPPAAQK